MAAKTYTIDGHCYWVSCQHSPWTPCTAAAHEPHGWISSDGRVGEAFFTDAPWVGVVTD